MAEIAFLIGDKVIAFDLVERVEHYRFGKILRHGRSGAVDAAESVFLGIFVKYGEPDAALQRTVAYLLVPMAVFKCVKAHNPELQALAAAFSLGETYCALAVRVQFPDVVTVRDKHTFILSEPGRTSVVVQSVRAVNVRIVKRNAEFSSKIDRGSCAYVVAIPVGIELAVPVDILAVRGNAAWSLARCDRRAASVLEIDEEVVKYWWVMPLIVKMILGLVRGKGKVSFRTFYEAYAVERSACEHYEPVRVIVEVDDCGALVLYGISPCCRWNFVCIPQPDIELGSLGSDDCSILRRHAAAKLENEPVAVVREGSAGALTHNPALRKVRIIFRNQFSYNDFLDCRTLARGFLQYLLLCKEHGLCRAAHLFRILVRREEGQFISVVVEADVTIGLAVPGQNLGRMRFQIAEHHRTEAGAVLVIFLGDHCHPVSVPADGKSAVIAYGIGSGKRLAALRVDEKYHLAALRTGVVSVHNYERRASIGNVQRVDFHSLGLSDAIRKVSPSARHLHQLEVRHTYIGKRVRRKVELLVPFLCLLVLAERLDFERCHLRVFRHLEVGAARNYKLFAGACPANVQFGIAVLLGNGIDKDRGILGKLVYLRFLPGVIDAVIQRFLLRAQTRGDGKQG